MNAAILDLGRVGVNQVAFAKMATLESAEIAYDDGQLVEIIVTSRSAVHMRSGQSAVGVAKMIVSTGDVLSITGDAKLCVVARLDIKGLGIDVLR